MEGWALNQCPVLRSVEKVARQGMAGVGHVDPDLVGAASVQLQGHQRPVPPAAQDAVCSPGALAVGADHLLHQGARLGSQRGVNHSGGGLRAPLAHRQVEPPEVPGVELIFQHLLGVGVLGGHQQAGGPTVQPVDGVEVRLLSRLFIIMNQKITQRIVIVPRPRVDGHPRRLVQDNQVLVLVDDLQGTGGGDDAAVPLGVG